jgi:hypothetical protein
MLTPKEAGALEVLDAIRNVAEVEITGLKEYEFKDKPFKRILERAQDGIELLINDLPKEAQEAIKAECGRYRPHTLKGRCLPIEPKRFQFLGCSCWVVKGQYANGGTALLVHADVAGHAELIATATVYVEGTPLRADEVLINDYSENDGLKAALVLAGIVKQTGRVVHTGRVTVEICEVLI